MIKIGVEFIRKIHINPAFWVVILGAVLTGHFREILIWFSVVIIHEMGHFAGAHLFKWRITRIDLLPFGGAAVVEEHGTKPFREELWVAVLGPLQHVWMITLAYLLYTLNTISVEDYHWFIVLNVTLFFFNLLPIWPLDGGKIVFAFFTKFLPFKYAQKQFLFWSFLCLCIGGFWQLILNPHHLNLWVVCLFLFFAHFMEWKQRHYVFMRFLLNRKPSSEQRTRTIVVSPNTPFKKVAHRLFKDLTHVIIVKSRNPITIHEKEFLEAYFRLDTPECAISKIFR